MRRRAGAQPTREHSHPRPSHRQNTLTASQNQEAAQPGDATEFDLVTTQPCYRAFFGTLFVGVALLPVFGIGLILLASVWYKTKSLRYRLTNERLFVTKGIIAKQVEEIELYRIKDQSMRQSIPQRLMGFGDVRIYSTDDSTPHVMIEGVKNPLSIKEQIRSAVRAARQKAGVRMTEYAQS